MSLLIPFTRLQQRGVIKPLNVNAFQLLRPEVYSLKTSFGIFGAHGQFDLIDRQMVRK